MKRTATFMLLGGVLLAGIVQADTPVSELWKKSLEAEASGKYAEALDFHQEVMPQGEDSYIVNLRAGWLYYLNTNYTAALDYYEQAASQSSGALSPLYGAMNCHSALGNSSRVIKVAKAVMVINELDYTANKMLADTYYADMEYSLAAAYYRKLNRLYPEDLAVASGLAWAYLEQGDVRDARPLFEQILVVSPDYAYAERGLNLCQRIASR